MAEDRREALASWIGKSVMILNDRGESFEGPIFEVTAQGAVIHYLANLEELRMRQATGEDPEDMRSEMRHSLMFFPWERVRVMSRLPTDEENRQAYQYIREN